MERGKREDERKIAERHLIKEMRGMKERKRERRREIPPADRTFILGKKPYL